MRPESGIGSDVRPRTQLSVDLVVRRCKDRSNNERRTGQEKRGVVIPVRENNDAMQNMNEGVD